MFTMQPLFWASFPLILTATTTSGFVFFGGLGWAWLGLAGLGQFLPSERNGRPSVEIGMYTQPCL